MYLWVGVCLCVCAFRCQTRVCVCVGLYLFHRWTTDEPKWRSSLVTIFSITSFTHNHSLPLTFSWSSYGTIFRWQKITHESVCVCVFVSDVVVSCVCFQIYLSFWPGKCNKYAIRPTFIIYSKQKYKLNAVVSLSVWWVCRECVPNVCKSWYLIVHNGKLFFGRNHIGHTAHTRPNSPPSSGRYVCIIFTLLHCSGSEHVSWNSKLKTHVYA